MNPWESLTKYYDKLVENGKKVCPIAHTYITVHIAVLIDKNGNFLYAMGPEVKGELIPVPCTIESENRTSSIAPHLISDQLQYVANYPGYKKHYQAYINQLHDYVEKNPNDEYAQSVYRYVVRGTILSDIHDMILQKTSAPQNKLNVLFAVYGLENEGIDLCWTEYYLNDVLGINGKCSVTGNMDYIPKTYPNNILSVSDMGKLFIAKTDSYGEYAQNAPGYIASQKVIHALQYMIYAKQNADRVEAEYNIRGFLDGAILTEDFKDWMREKYPGCWNKFIKILNRDEKEAVGN